MKLPILVFEGYDVSFFDSVRDAASSIEVVDLDSVQACDSEGRKIHFDAEEGETNFYASAIFKSIEKKPTMREEIRLVLTENIANFRGEEKEALVDYSLDELISKAVEIDKLRKSRGCFGLIKSIFTRHK